MIFNNLSFFKKYTSIENYLERFTILKIGKLHIRIHNILSSDKTPFFHNHPFGYISFILKGGYIEERLVNNKIVEKKYSRYSIIVRNKNMYHRIKTLEIPTKTLFIAYGRSLWKLKTLESKNRLEDGIYTRTIKNEKIYCKVKDGMFYIGCFNFDVNKINIENRLSRFQDFEKDKIKLIC